MRVWVYFISLYVLGVSGLAYSQDSEIDEYELIVQRDSLYPIDKWVPNFEIEVEFPDTTVKEQWYYFEVRNGYVLRTEYRYQEFLFTEQYVVYNDQLVGADISEDGYFNGFDSIISVSWSYHCGMQNGELTYLSSNGHGRSETDEWDGLAEAISRYNSRKKQLKQLMLNPLD